MSAADENGWVDHDGGLRPVDSQTVVHVRLRDGRVLGATKAWKRIWKWTKREFADDIVAYREVKQEPSP